MRGYNNCKYGIKTRFFSFPALYGIKTRKSWDKNAVPRRRTNSTGEYIECNIIQLVSVNFVHNSLDIVN